MMNRNVWVTMSFGSDASWEGNAGYVDDIRSKYEFTNYVPNSTRLRIGDILIIRDKYNVLGCATIGDLTTADGTTSFRRCPACGTTKFKFRKTKTPPYRCRFAHEFEKPNSEITSCTKFSVSYSDSFVPSNKPVAISLLDSIYLDKATQHSIRPADYGKAMSMAIAINPQNRELFIDPE